MDLQMFGLEEISAAYYDVFGRRIYRPQLEDVAALIGSGMDTAVIVAAIEETAGAPAPSWRYTMAILKRCAAARITTIEAWKADKNAWTGRRQQPQKQLIHQQYTQREHHENDLAELDELMRDYKQDDRSGRSCRQQPRKKLSHQQYTQREHHENTLEQDLKIYMREYMKEAEQQ